MESHAEGEVNVVSGLTVGAILSPVAHTNSLNVVSSGVELCSERQQGEGLSSGNVSGEVVLEEVEALLAINGVHSDKRARVNAVSQELEGHAGGQVLHIRVGLGSGGESHDTSVGVLEHTGEGVFTRVGQLDCSDGTLSVNQLAAGAEELAWGHLVTNLIKGGLHRLCEDTSELGSVVPALGSVVLEYLGHDLGLLLLAGLGQEIGRAHV